MMFFNHKHNKGFADRRLFWVLAVTTLLAVGVSILCLLSGVYVIFQNLFYLPIIIACARYSRRGFIFSIALACFYFLLILAFTRDASILLETLISVAVFIIAAGVVSYLSGLRTRAEKERGITLQRQEGINLLQQSLLAPAQLDRKLKIITDSIVRLFDADFCRVWLIRPGDLCEQGCIHALVQEGPHVCRYRDRCLHLLSSSGRYTHTDGKGHRRIPFGCYKIGRVASGEKYKFISNDVRNDPLISDHEWAGSLGLVSSAGYQLRIPGEQTLGVLALFAKHPITHWEDVMLDGLGSSVALIVQQAEVEEQLRLKNLVFDASIAANSIADVNGIIVEANNAFVRCWGYPSKNEVVGKPLPHFFNNPDKAVAILEALNGTGQWEGVFSAKRSNGSAFDAHGLATTLRDSQGSIVGYQSAVLDITDQKRAEQQARERMKELQAFFSLSEITEREGITLDELYQELVSILPESWQYPEITCARIVIGDREFRTKNFMESSWKLSAPVKVAGSVSGRIDVGYLEERPEQGEGPFMKEERLLIDAIAERLGHVTERKRMEEALQASEIRFRTLFQASSDGILIADLETKGFTYANPAACRLLGYSQTELTTMDVAAIHPKTDLPRVMAEFEAQSRGDKMLAEGLPCLRKDGTIVYADVIAGSMTIDDRACNVGFFRDITERKRLEEVAQKKSEELLAANIRLEEIMRTQERSRFALLSILEDEKLSKNNLHDSEERFRLAINATDDGLWEWDIQKNQEFFAPRWCEIIGYAVDDPELTHSFNSWVSRIHPDDLDRVNRALTDHLEKGARYDIDYRHRHKSGEYCWQNSKGKAVFDESGKPIKMVGCISDITDRKRAVEKISASLHEKEVLLREIHHRVKNNMQVISSLIGLQNSYLTEGADVRVALHEMQNRIKSMAIVHEKLYRSENLALIDVREYFSSLSASVVQSLSVDPDRVALRLDVGRETLGIDAAVPCGLLVNELITNALKHGFPGGRKGVITVSMGETAEGSYRISVKDDGIGLPAGFDKNTSGSLGLRLVRILAQQLGGTVDMLSGEGAEFIITFPQVKEDRRDERK